MNRNQLASTIKQLAVLRGDFLLRSGARAAVYFDKYQFESQPAVLSAIAAHLAPLVPSGVDALAGLELGGVPIATALPLRTSLPAIFVRKRAKEYGTARLAEGGEIAGRRLLIIEDVVTSGGQVVASCAALRALGAEVTHALCVVDRDQGGLGALAAVGVTLVSLFNHEEILSVPSPIKVDAKEARARQIQESIRAVLIRDWDPIGVRDEPQARDEYDGYVGGVYRLLASGASTAQVAAHLADIEVSSMGLTTDAGRLLPVATRLKELDVRLGDASS